MLRFIMKSLVLMHKKVRVGDSTRLLTLSTCDNALNNARYILVARNVKG